MTNLEVFQLLSESLDEKLKEAEDKEGFQQTPETTTSQPAKDKKKNRKLRHRDFIENSVHEYLQGSSCAYANIDTVPELVYKLRRKSKKNENNVGDDNSARAENTLKRCKIESNDHNISMDSNDVNDVKTSKDEQKDEEEEEGYGLTDAETLQILNHFPTEPVELHLMIEDLSNRIDEDRQNELLQLISQYTETVYDNSNETGYNESNECFE